MGALAQAPLRSRHPPRVRNGTTQQADKSIERQQIRVRLAKGQTHRVMPYSSSLACETCDLPNSPVAEVPVYRCESQRARTGLRARAASPMSSELQLTTGSERSALGEGRARTRRSANAAYR